VRPGDTVCATLTVTDINAAKKRVTLSTECTVAGKPVVTGEAVVMATSAAAK
jgi:3-hydroxybutyryl-CoA dehydratase